MIDHLPTIPGFTLAPHSHLGETRAVYRRGHGPAVIVMSEIPGITPQVATFATTVADAGFSVWMPQLFGTPLEPITLPYLTRSVLRICISKEFSVLAANQSSPIVDWLRALAREAHEACGGPGVGAVGMCLTGNFGLAMMLDAPVIAPVLSPPAAAMRCMYRRRNWPPLTTRSRSSARAFSACASTAIRSARPRASSACAANSATPSKASRSTPVTATGKASARRTAC